ncbi:retrovirus-related pol polyprotein from transposon TNT 1-94 [Tanacetum coccineum]
MKAEALKEQTKASRPIKALTMYPPNTPETLVPMALTKEIKEMKDIFEELEAEVDQNVVHRKHAEIERKNLLIAKNNLIADCLSKDVFYITTNSKLTISRFIEMHDAHTVVQACCLELEAELSKLRDKIQTDDHNELVNRFSNLEITHDKHIEQTTALLTKNENLKVQIHNKMQCVTTNPVKPRVLAPGKYAIDVEPIPPRNRNNREVHLDYLKHLKESVETIREIVEEAKVERPLDRSLASACLYTKHSQELLEYVIGTCPKDFNQRDKKHAYTPLTKKKQVTFEVQCATSNSNTHKHVEQLNTQKTNVPVPPSTGVNSCTDASGSQPRSNTKKNRILPAKSVNKKNVEEHPRTNKSNLKTKNRVDSSISSKRTVINLNSHTACKTCNKCLISANHDMCVVTYLHSVNASPSIKNVVRKVKQVWKPKQVKQVWKPTGKILPTVGYQWIPTGRTFTLGARFPLTRLTTSKVVQIVLWYLDSGCSKHMTGDRSRLRNFVQKFIGTVRFESDHFGAIMGYGDYVIGDSVISRAEVVATTCYTRNRSLIHTLHNKTPYELVHDKKPDITFFRVFGALCYPTNDSEDLGKLQPTADIGIFIGYAPSRKGYRIFNKRTRRIMETIHVQFDELTEQMAPMQLSTGPAPTFLTPGQISSGLVPNPVPAAPYVPPTNKELEILFQPMFDEYLEPPRVERPVSPAPAIPIPVNSAGTPSSTTIDQDAPSLSHSLSSSALQSPSIHQGVVAESTLVEENPFTSVDNDPFINIFAPEPTSEASSSGDVSSAESTYVTQTLHHLEKWSKDHPLDNVIGNPSRPVSTRKQLATDALWCLYNFVLSKVKPKNFKSAIIEDCWFQAMQDEIHEFDRLQV